MNIEVGKLYFVKNEFYERFNGHGLLGNKDEINGQKHNRPCCCLFDNSQFDNIDIYWLVPISSQIGKYQSQYQKSIDKYKICDNISFGYILGIKKAFLPQNLFPVTINYIDNVYIDNNTLLPVVVSPVLVSELSEKARKKIRYNKKGKHFGLTDIMGIYQELILDETNGETSNDNNKVLLYL